MTPGSARRAGVVVAARLLAGLTGLAGMAGPAEAADPALGKLEREVAASVDLARQQRGLATLAWNEPAARLARAHSTAMAEGRRGFGHDGFAERAEHLTQEMPLAGAAENISRHTRPPSEVTEVALAAWLASPVHRKNLTGDFQVTGVGVARAPDGTVYVTQLFVRLRSP